MLMPLAPLNALPLRLTAPVSLVVTVELFAAIEPPTLPAVTPSIWLSRSGCLLCLSAAGLVLPWPKAEPLTRTEAVTRVHTSLFILSP
jgi:hypothetical protein